MSESVPETPNPVSEAAKHIGRLGGLAVGAQRRAAKGQEPAEPKVPDVTFDEDLMAQYRKEFARQGGLKGGAARSAKLSKERKQEIGRMGGIARWGKHL